MNERTDYVPHDGRQIALRICGVFEISGGLIAAWREYFDSAAVAAP
jgi:limonene-1,2-epoxide hydrolase